MIIIFLILYLFLKKKKVSYPLQSGSYNIHLIVKKKSQLSITNIYKYDLCLEILPHPTNNNYLLFDLSDYDLILPEIMCKWIIKKDSKKPNHLILSKSVNQNINESQDLHTTKTFINPNHFKLCSSDHIHNNLYIFHLIHKY